MAVLNDKQIHILQVAEKLFAENGFDGTSIRSISKEAGINIAMVSYYFGSKEKLLERLIYLRTSDLKLKLEQLQRETIDPIKKIEKYIALYIEKIDANRDMHKILHFEISTNKRAMDLKAFHDIKKKNLTSLTAIIEEGQALHVFKKDVLIPLITPTILGTYFHFHSNRVFFEALLQLDTEEKYNYYIKNEVTQHIQQTIKSLLLHEK